MSQVINAQCGESLWLAVQRVINTAKCEGKEFILRFNDINLRINPASYEGDIFEIYELKGRLARLEK